MQEETVQEKMARRSQPSQVTLQDGRTVRVVSSQVKRGRIARLGIDPGGPPAPIEWVDAALVVSGH